MPVPKEQPPRKLSGPRTGVIFRLWRDPCPEQGRRRDSDLRRRDRGGILGLRALPLVQDARAARHATRDKNRRAHGRGFETNHTA